MHGFDAWRLRGNGYWDTVGRIGLYALFLAASFVFWHSGARAAAVCREAVFVSSGTLSIWPPGARCAFGEPTSSETFVNPWFVGTLVFVLLVAVVVGEALARVWPSANVREQPRRVA